MATTHYRDCADFLYKHQIKKTDPNPRVVTNTRIGIKGDTNFYGGTYHIPETEYKQFLDLYFQDIVAKNQLEYLTEKQLISGGPILIDLDFRHSYETVDRQYTAEHVDDLVQCYLAELEKIYQIDEDVKFQIFVLEKPDVNRVEKDKITKDGIHMIIHIQSDPTVAMILRERVMQKVSDQIWRDFPITNTWDAVFDDGISKGTVGWQLFGSRKPNNAKYNLTKVYDVTVSEDTNKFEFNQIPINSFNILKNRHKLSVRCKPETVLFLKGDFKPVYDQYKLGAAGRSRPNNQVVVRNRFAGDNLANIMSISNEEDLKHEHDEFIKHISKLDYQLREANDYAFTLPPSYYEQGSHSKWIRVGWALKNIDNRLLIVFIAFSAQSSAFLFSNIPEICELWKGFDDNRPDGLTKRSLMHWSKEDAKQKFYEVRNNSIDYYIERTINTRSVGKGKDRKEYRSGDYELAGVLYHVYKDQFVCTNINQNLWFEYKKNCWETIDSGTTLRKKISTEICELYNKKSYGIACSNSVEPVEENTISQEIETTTPAEVNTKTNTDFRLMQILNIAQRLVSTTDKQKIMMEAREQFYDGDFMKNLDTNPYLLCFNNGVVDFAEKTFRRGRPEDHISMSTRINYLVKLTAEHEPIVAKIHDFMNKLFPEPELCQYMWDHLASVLIGTPGNQTMNMYVGHGQNGKSVLVNLMEMVLGEYKGDVPLTLITGSRAKPGGLTPEIASLKGIRYAVMQEPSKGDKINEGIMKQITSGTDALTGRALYSPPITFTPQLKLVVCSNTMMEINATDHGTWRRIRVVPFKSLFTENPVQGDKTRPYQFPLDKRIKEQFEEWKEVFAHMLVQRGFITNGLVTDCDIVMSASNEYRKKEDTIAQFIQEKLYRTAKGKVSKTELIGEFTKWYQAVHNQKPKTKDMLEAMVREFGEPRKDGWTGVCVQYEQDKDDDEEDEDEEEGMGEDEEEDLIDDL